MILRNKFIERELVIELGSEDPLAHHMLVPPSGAQPGIMISNRLSQVEFGNNPAQGVWNWPTGFE
jgi:hypothetical protein